MIDTIARLVENLQKLFSMMKWSHVAQIVSMVIMFTLGTAFWENRPTIYSAIVASRFSNGVLENVSNTTKLTVKRIVNGDPNVIGLQVVSTDFRNNIRTNVYFYTKDTTMQAEFDESERARIAPLQLFVLSDKVNNDRLIGVIEQEFVCSDVPLKLASFIPNHIKSVRMICSISVPPRYGRMVGYVNLWLSVPADRDNLQEYKQIARSVSDEIYDRDVMHTVK